MTGKLIKRNQEEVDFARLSFVYYRNTLLIAIVKVEILIAKQCESSAL